MRRLLLALILAATLLAPAAAMPLPPAKVTLGDDVFLKDAWRDLKGRCIGIVTNQSGVTSQQESIVDAVRRNSNICVKALYSPEHGLRGDQPAGVYVASYTDPRSGLPVYSLYGKTRHPSAAMLAGVDVLVFDIQDVGNRAYTYISTMAYIMQSAKAYGKEVWILDRPNPIGGELVEGPVLDPKFSSFIGLYPIAMRHGMTVGELAKLFNDRFAIGANLRVIPMRGWNRGMTWSDTGLSWVQTSPYIPEWETTLVYPATGLIDNAGINNGTGFTKPFKLAGAYGFDGYKFADYLNARAIPGVHFRPASWSPIAGFWAGKTLSGVELVVFDPHAFESVRTAVELLVAARTVSPGVIQIKETRPLDIDWGTDSLRLGLLRGESVEQIEAGWEPSLTAFRALRAKYLLY